MKIELHNVNTNKLHDELIVSGITPLLVESVGNTSWITVNDSDVPGANSVIAVHDPSPIQVVDAKTVAISDIEKATTIASLKAAMLKFVEAN